jgi:hypothetical protein
MFCNIDPSNFRVNIPDFLHEDFISAVCAEWRSPCNLKFMTQFGPTWLISPFTGPWIFTWTQSSFNTKELSDPWLYRTGPLNFKLEPQVVNINLRPCKQWLEYWPLINGAFMFLFKVGRFVSAPALKQL